MCFKKQIVKIVGTYIDYTVTCFIKFIYDNIQIYTIRIYRYTKRIYNLCIKNTSCFYKILKSYPMVILNI